MSTGLILFAVVTAIAGFCVLVIWSRRDTQRFHAKLREQPWAMRCRCARCGDGSLKASDGFRPSTAEESKANRIAVCPQCGHTLFHAIRPGRRVLGSDGELRWEWNDDYVKDDATSDETTVH